MFLIINSFAIDKTVNVFYCTINFDNRQGKKDAKRAWE